MAVSSTLSIGFVAVFRRAMSRRPIQITADHLPCDATILGHVVSDGAGVEGFARGVASADVLPVTGYEDGVLIEAFFSMAVVSLNADASGTAEGGHYLVVPPFLTRSA
jgi:hypothetical protein